VSDEKAKTEQGQKPTEKAPAKAPPVKPPHRPEYFEKSEGGKGSKQTKLLTRSTEKT
jgi:hypothetical protein